MSTIYPVETVKKVLILDSIKAEKNRKQREYRLNNKNVHTKKYEKSKKGFLMRTYRNMKSRVGGILKSKAHLYRGKALLDKDAFYLWSMDSSTFNQLFFQWEFLNYDMKLTPSIDRINPSDGYTLNNMRWITHSENSRLGAISRHSKVKINE